MGASEDKQDDLAAFQPDPLEKLTIQDALVISGLYAVEADTEKSEQIKALAQKHPLFAENPDDTAARVNKFTNLMQAGQTLKAVEAAARDLKTEHRQLAFAFAAEAALTGEVLTDEKEKILQTLAIKLALDKEYVDRKLAEMQRKAGR